MRRGLMAWDADEIPIPVLRERIARLQAAMAVAGQDALIVYTNFVRSAAVSYLTAFSPYWADGILLVPREGEPIFATTLSKRVGSWIQSVKPVGDLINSPSPGTVLGQRLAVNGGIQCLAILELDAFPAGLYSELTTALPGVEIVDGSDTFASARGAFDNVERMLLEIADAIAQAALGHLRIDTVTDVGKAVGTVEEYARLQGAEEIYTAIAPDLDSDRRFLRLSGNRPLGRRFAVRATVAYKGTWVRRTKTWSQDDADRRSLERADIWFDGLLAGIGLDRSLQDQLTIATGNLGGAHLADWMAETSVGTRPLTVIASPAEAEEFSRRVPALVLTLGLHIDGVPWCGAGLAIMHRKVAA